MVIKLQLSTSTTGISTCHTRAPLAESAKLGSCYLEHSLGVIRICKLFPSQNYMY